MDGIRIARARRATHIGYRDPVVAASLHPVIQPPDHGAALPQVVLFDADCSEGRASMSVERADAFGMHAVHDE